MTTVVGDWFKLGTLEFTDMWKRRSFLAIVTRAVALFVMASVVLESSSLGRTVAGGNYESTSSVPTSVSGQSWLTHLGRSFDETSMGKTGRLGPPTATPQAELVRWQLGLAARKRSRSRCGSHGCGWANTL
jgi:hypothetical protein